MKYPKQGRLVVGIVTVQLIDGNEKGWCCEPFDCTGKTVVTITMFNKLIWDKICHVQYLKDGGYHWVNKFCHPDDLWEEELLQKMKGFGKVKAEKLNSKGFTKVYDITYATTNQLQDTVLDMGNSFSLTYLLRLQEQVQCAIPGDVPPSVTIDHRKAENPFLSCYGTIWEEHIQ